MNETTFERLAFLVAEEAGAVEVKPESNLQYDLGMDSIDITELVFGIEAEFEVSVTEDELFNAKTVDEIVKLIDSRLASK